MYHFLNTDNATNDLFKLTRNQKLVINQGREQIKYGQSFSNDEVNAEIDKWLGEK